MAIRAPTGLGPSRPLSDEASHGEVDDGGHEEVGEGVGADHRPLQGDQHVGVLAVHQAIGENLALQDQQVLVADRAGRDRMVAELLNGNHGHGRLLLRPLLRPVLVPVCPQLTGRLPCQKLMARSERKFR
jgi:hypothetical protein